MIFDIAGREQFAMRADQVRWFLNGKAFLRHLADLPSVKVAAYCQTCYAQGLDDEVVVSQPDADTYLVRCAHQQRTLPAHEVRDADELLARLGWSLRCAGRCARLGMYDGVQGGNDPQSGEATVTCGCTERRFRVGA